MMRPINANHQTEAAPDAGRHAGNRILDHNSTAR